MEKEHGKARHSYFALAILLLVLAALVFLAPQNENGGQPKQSVVRFNGTVITVEVADTRAAVIQGLSGREALPEGEGMFFVMESLDHHGFWMKDMNFPIDIIWLDSDFIVVHIAHGVSPESFPQVFYPKEPAFYVLEVNAGLARDTGLLVGEKITFEQRDLEAP